MNNHVANDLPTRADTQNLSLKKISCMWAARYRKSLTGKELFYRLNEQFISNRAGDYHSFATRDLIGEQQTINISQATCRRVPIHRTFPRWGKSSKREWRAAEILIKQFVSHGKSIFVVWTDDLWQIEVEFSFFRLGRRTLQTTNIFTSALPTRAKHKTLPCSS